MIGIIDYGMGNLKSVFNALVVIGASPKIIRHADEFNDLSHLVIPGVGAFSQAMTNLENKNLIQPIKEFALSGKPLLGICLGMQLMATLGHEPYTTSGINLISGEVCKFHDISLRIPHVGWNSIELKHDHYLFDGVKREADFYFVHSYYFVVQKPENILASCDYGIKFCAAVSNENIIGLQFHPEKSQKNGLKILNNFCFYNNNA